MSAPVEVKTKTYPVVEVFGPVIQGEGPLAGTPTDFIRFGGCDYRCSWCDSLYAVLPDQVRANSRKLSTTEMLEELADLHDGDAPGWVTISGGNPAMLDLSDFVGGVHFRQQAVAVETQGSMWKPWLSRVDSLVVSPKGPSSGMADKTLADLPAFMDAAYERHPEPEFDGIKVVVFDEDDFDFAREVIERYGSKVAHNGWPAFLSVGTDPPLPDEPYADTLVRIGDRYRWLCDRVAENPWCGQYGVKVLPQLHVIAYGHARGV